MKKQKLVVLVLTICMLFSGLAYADGRGKMDLESKFYKKAKFIMSNQEELGITDNQIKEIKKLKMDTKKDLIKVGAEIEIVKIDIMAHLWEDKIDIAVVDALIDKKYELKKEKAKMVLSSYAYIGKSLTDEQLTKLKALCKKSLCKKFKNTKGYQKN